MQDLAGLTWLTGLTGLTTLSRLTTLTGAELPESARSAWATRTAGEEVGPHVLLTVVVAHTHFLSVMAAAVTFGFFDNDPRLVFFAVLLLFCGFSRHLFFLSPTGFFQL